MSFMIGVILCCLAFILASIATRSRMKSHGIRLFGVVGRICVACDEPFYHDHAPHAPDRTLCPKCDLYARSWRDFDGYNGPGQDIPTIQDPPIADDLKGWPAQENFSDHKPGPSSGPPQKTKGSDNDQE